VNGDSEGAPRAEARAPRPERGEELELEIDSLAHGGEGVARYGDGGYVVFVSGAVPGDRVRAVVVKRKRSYAHARAVEILSPSPERIEPQAQHPGVAWQVLPYERQLQIKAAQVRDALERIGRLEGFELQDIVPALAQWRYRNKLEYSFGENDDGGLVCGFHAPGGWKRVEPVEDCMLASQIGNRARETALRWGLEKGLRPWDRRRETVETGAALLRNLVVREGRRTGKLQVRLVTTPGEVDVDSLASTLRRELGDEVLSGVLWTSSSALAETTLGGDTELVWGEAELPERLRVGPAIAAEREGGGAEDAEDALDLRISPEAFFQTNTEMAEVLYGLAAEYAALEGWERVYDLYCGTGTIALALAQRAGEMWGIELSEQAVADAIAAAKRNGISNARFFAGDVRLALPELLERAGRPDVLVVDPPRAGLSAKVVRRIIDTSPKRVVYVSCNPTTLAPNAAQLVEAGYRLLKVRPVDMFPQTPHIECVALLERE
jgi:23S rRNA (uracil1939-C5)-methyltransferase